MHKENFKLVLDKITSCPETWYQGSWHGGCGTRHCFAGWAQTLKGMPPMVRYVRQDARQFLQLTYVEANYLFDSSRTLEDFENFLDGAPYDVAGEYAYAAREGFVYDREGFDNRGYNCHGIDRDGYDLDGLNEQFELKPIK